MDRPWCRPGGVELEPPTLRARGSSRARVAAGRRVPRARREGHRLRQQEARRVVGRARARQGPTRMEDDDPSRCCCDGLLLRSWWGSKRRGGSRRRVPPTGTWSASEWARVAAAWSVAEERKRASFFFSPSMRASLGEPASLSLFPRNNKPLFPPSPHPSNDSVEERPRGVVGVIRCHRRHTMSYGVERLGGGARGTPPPSRDDYARRGRRCHTMS